MNKIALAGLAAIFAAGAWLIVAPFVLRYQPPGTPWAAASRLDVETGAVLAAAGFAGFFTALADRVRELYAGRRERARWPAGVKSSVRDL